MFSITLTVAKQHRLLNIHNNFFMLGYITIWLSCRRVTGHGTSRTKKFDAKRRRYLAELDESHIPCYPNNPKYFIHVGSLS